MGYKTRLENLLEFLISLGEFGGGEFCIDTVINKNTALAAVTLAQVFVDNLDYTNFWRENYELGENIIKFIYKWLGGENEKDVDDALSIFYQHNDDCRFECFCCGQCEDALAEIPDSVPSVKDEYIKEIIRILQLKRNRQGE